MEEIKWSNHHCTVNENSLMNGVKLGVTFYFFVCPLMSPDCTTSQMQEIPLEKHPRTMP